ncbi:hypothetical protein FRACYDRAFT_254752 [Fragilariopsis cylindrus CCMP1102]|uniref:FAS1 domain-containing protein n=1 Tax=Fragilariopsis cylindrus CCMP1102 TaxID=635003 RepID=A0A1E7EKK0_9STRA|nr:hypothetical protein FRACYDRAFT_254752 [Fragilariopsis cylindrus CCMP1102]|eukprot:OEU06408.1 hypothetical protein FRACYDRAFT_254752 [Fragilariopsis cylindrus CCMP1102]
MNNGVEDIGFGNSDSANNDAVELATIKKDIVTTAIENGSFTPQLNLVPTLTYWWSLHTVFAPIPTMHLLCGLIVRQIGTLVNNDNLIAPDVLATNGVMHVIIDAVLVPPSINVVDYLDSCPEIVEPVVPVVPEGGDNEITDQLGDLFGNLDVEDLGDIIDVAVGNASQDPDLGE